SISIIFAILLVMFGVVRDQIVQRETVMAGHEIDAVVSGTPVIAVKVCRTRETPSQIRQLTGVALAEATHGVAKFSIPFGPVNGKISDLVGPDVPRLRDQDRAV